MRSYKNYLFAHNGARFDFRLVWEAFQRFADIRITGTITSIK